MLVEQQTRFSIYSFE